MNVLILTSFWTFKLFKLSCVIWICKDKYMRSEIIFIFNAIENNMVITTIKKCLGLKVSCGTFHSFL